MAKSFLKRMQQAQRDTEQARELAAIQIRRTAVLNNKYGVGPKGRYGSVQHCRNCEVVDETGPAGNRIHVGVKVLDIHEEARFHARGGDQQGQVARVWKDTRSWDPDVMDWVAEES